MIRKIISLFFSNDTEEDDMEENQSSAIPKRQLAKEFQTARKFKNIELLTDLLMILISLDSVRFRTSSCNSLPILANRKPS